MRETILLGVTVLALGLAGCTAQVSPLQVKIDSAPIEVQLDKTTHPSDQVTISGLSNEETIQVEVHARAVSDKPGVVLVTVKDSAGTQLAQDRVSVEAAMPQGNTSGNQTGNQTGNTSGTTNTGVLVMNVNVKGKDNVVVVTQALEGSATVSVAAHSGKSTATSGGNTTMPDAPTSPSTPTYP